MTFTKLKTKTQWNLLVQCFGMLVGTTTHLLWIIHNGFLSENYHVGIVSRVFWDSLTFLDPIAAILVIFRPKMGIWLIAIIISVDVLHNGALCFNMLFTEDVSVIDWIQGDWMFWCQLIFGIFVIGSFKSNLKEIRKKN